MDTNIQKYIAFIKTVEYGSFTKAAEVLNYSQSGISRMITALEPYPFLLSKAGDDSEVRELSPQSGREIGIAFRDKSRLSLAAKHFLEYLKYR